jgi:hypothetical protein
MSMFSSIATSSSCEAFLHWIAGEQKNAKSADAKLILENLRKKIQDLKGSADAGYE